MEETPSSLIEGERAVSAHKSSKVDREAENPRMSSGRRPTGTLTFLFTDIEGSTKLGVALGTDRYHEVLETYTRRGEE
jgi:class 3 adenylate cyclase